ncbi:SMP-30/gluconolactonase/LRE family protein [Portibacter lacus]|uniref:Gluconolactonase n=1 Tax=Portibacter lacus TaxID=1099794 RepID=A0AA37SS24_9BACT|nr:SMP-30/gluconolactonase/LRE family protein [Portibacter lacus]GLR18730.1 gluconolactonase [Portibacter lacus]
MEAKPIFDIKLEHGEGPVWCPIEGKFYCVDLLKGHYYKVDYQTQESERFDVGQALGVMALRAEGGSVVAVRDGFGTFDEERKTLTLIKNSPEREIHETRMNDGAVDPAGRFLAATMTYDGMKPVGNLYGLESDDHYTILEKNLLLPNGMGWSPDNKKFFLIDTHENAMFAYDYEMTSGKISNKTIHIQWSKEEYPDGMAIDSEGGFWVAMWMGSKIEHYDSGGKKIEEVKVPVLHTTSCCFGGKDMKTLLITTSNLNLSKAEKAANPLAGRVFSVETDIKGQVQKRYKG